jgi:hypothetical protein
VSASLEGTPEALDSPTALDGRVDACAAATLPALRRYRATLLIERVITLNAVNDSEFETAAIGVLESELDRAKYRLVRITSTTTAIAWN